MGVKIYGSNDFTPGDVPTGTTLERGYFSDGILSASGQEIWAGCLGSGCVPPGVGAGYSDQMFRTATAWSFGGYGHSSMNIDEQGNDCNVWNGAGCMPKSLQDSNNNTGWNSFLNGSAKCKRLGIRVGTDLAASSVVNYVRVWVKAGSFSGGAKYFQPFWWQVPDSVGSADFPAVSSGKTWDSTTHFVATPSGYNNIQWSSKLTGSWTPAQMANLVWGVRHGRGGEDGNPGTGVINVCEMAIEVGYTAVATYAVTTGPAIGVTGTTATLTGSVDPFGDSSGNWYFQYGTTPALGTSSPLVPQPSSTLYDVSLNIAGLTPDTVYYYRAAANDSTGTPHYGAILSFLTVSSCSFRTSLVGG